MKLTTAIVLVFVLLAAVVLAYPLVMPRPPVIDETQLVEPPIIVPPKPEPKPIPDVPDTGLIPPAPPPPPTENVIERPGGAGGNCSDGSCSRGVLPRLRARRSR